jgi:hypothetical protein
VDALAAVVGLGRRHPGRALLTAAVAGTAALTGTALARRLELDEAT